MKKKGVIRPWLIGIVILIIMAIPLIIFAKKITQAGVDKRELCRQSVILRSKSIYGIEPGRQITDLNCQTEVFKINTQSEEEIKKIFANALYDCWYMMGEGKLDFLSEYEGEKACVICSIIKFDENLKGKKITGLWKYLEETKIPLKDITYAQYILGDTDINKLKEEELIDETNDFLYTKDDYAVVFAVVEAPEKEEIFLKGFLGGGIGAVSSGIVSSFLVMLGVVSGPVGLVVTGVAAMVGGLIGESGNIVNTVQTFAKCGVGGKGRCVNMFLIPYDATHIRQKCEVILSIPPEEGV